MKQPTLEEITKALARIEEMSHYEMCRLWRFGEPDGKELLLRSDLPTGEAFRRRLFYHFGGFTPEISKQLGW
jgi:hypothetical protein